MSEISVKKADLRVWRKLDTGNKGARTESCLLNVTKVIFWVAVQYQLSDLLHWELSARPDFSDVEDVEIDLCDVFRLHDLNQHGPTSVSAAFNVLEEIALCEIWVFAHLHHGLFISEILDSLCYHIVSQGIARL